MASTPARAYVGVLRDQLVVVVLYVAAAQLAFSAAVVHGSACPIWPPTAIAFVAVLWRGRSILPGLVVGILLANITRPVPALVVATTIAANALEPFLAVWLVRRLGGDTRLVAVRDIAVFVAAIGGAALVSATGGVGGLLATGVVDLRSVPEVGVLWALGNVAGAICVAPLVLVPAGRGTGGRPEILAAVACALVLGAIGIGRSALFVVFPVLIWAGLRLGQRGAAAITLVVSGLTVAFAARGEGPFVQSDATYTLLTAQGFILVTALTTLVVAAITDDRRRTAIALATSEADKLELLQEQAALRRVATAVAEQRAPSDLMTLVAHEVANLAGVECGTVVRHIDNSRIEVAGQWLVSGVANIVGERIGVAPGGPFEQARVTGGPVRFDERDAERPTMPPWVQRVGAPIQVEGRFWGAILAATTDTHALSDRTEERLGRFAQLVATAIAGAEQRELLTKRATTDPLTGLLNHRAFHERLHTEVARAQRHDRDLAVAAFDIDHFKRVNDTLGHAAGDALLKAAAERLRRAARTGDHVGRLGGDELAVIMPEISGLRAFRAADRLRKAICDDDAGAGPVTASAGTCDLTEAADADSLLRLADGALYWAKAHGRNICFRYTPGVVEELSAVERAERLTRSQALSGISALARAIDARDPSTTRHSERVAELAARLANVRGWEPQRVARLREAALLHDVGKVGIPDAVLFKPGSLTEAERGEVRRHAELGAQIASEVLDEEQVEWILLHHERIDGAGYPRGLTGPEIPEGARLLAVADAWDAMTRARPYSLPVPLDAAYRECRRHSGTQFCPDAVAALTRLWDAGRLDVDATSMSRPGC